MDFPFRGLRRCRPILTVGVPLVFSILLACQVPGGKPGQLPPIVTAIKGTVRDAVSGAALSGVNVHTEPATESVTTGADGSFSLSQGITPQTVYRITATKDGYLPGQAGFAAVEGNASEVDLALVPSKPLLSSSRDTLEFGAFESSSSFALSNTGDAGAVLNFQVASAAAWVKSMTPASGSLEHPVAVVVEIDRSLLGTPYGLREATIEITSNGGAKTVTLRVDNPDPAKPYISVSPQQLDFGLAGADRTVLLRNAGTGTLHWQATPSDEWVSVSKTSGDLAYGPYELLTLSVDRYGLPEGPATATVSLSATDSAAMTQTIHLQLDVGGTPVTSVAPSDVDFGTTSTTSTFTVRNSGYGTLRYELEPPPVDWLTITDPPAASWQTLAAGASKTVTVKLVRTSLPPGMHYSSIVVRSDENPSNTPMAGGNRAVSIHAEVDNAPVLLATQLFVNLGTSQSGTLTLENTGWGVASFAVTSKPSWLSITPDEADIVTPFGSPPQSQSLVLTVDRTGLGANTYDGTIHIESAAGNVDVAVRMTVSGGTP